jgi:hypothetical protein
MSASFEPHSGSCRFSVPAHIDSRPAHVPSRIVELHFIPGIAIMLAGPQPPVGVSECAAIRSAPGVPEPAW